MLLSFQVLLHGSNSLEFTTPGNIELRGPTGRLTQVTEVSAVKQCNSTCPRCASPGECTAPTLNQNYLKKCRVHATLDRFLCPITTHTFLNRDQRANTVFVKVLHLQLCFACTLTPGYNLEENACEKSSDRSLPRSSKEHHFTRHSY
ncbi:hypothetical protein NDU88_007101 [Pleurodeles waltl]|uniref:Uncharacterized protein n=1 Tax=Pleurodeles waltl TaxID=8319 RepID=A0AAV7N169_PLEWA|nr:hypothetical protein NDU88_007101 [Pleurodeles waltl]